MKTNRLVVALLVVILMPACISAAEKGQTQSAITDQTKPTASGQTISAETGIIFAPEASELTVKTPVTAKLIGPGTFDIGNKTFLLNGRPFLVKAAEIHYPRIPKEYWEHRMQLCKALGMNTICMYVFWNYHEEKEGVYDFKGQKDISDFCRLAQKHGLYVIVRPGPYVCAEWEMGGLPWWLLKKKDIRLRDEDPYFMECTRLFMLEVGKQLADLQITRGGNILMVQVENEYGSYGINKSYVSKIRDIIKESGLTEVLLFQCDWSSNFKDNALDDLLWTVNFGTGANIDAQFSELSRLRPNTPLMCSEFWSGWFDNWGRPHETRDAKAMVDGLRDMLERNISFSLYMTHGGSTFGHWGGANSPGFSPMCSSYDYDAPISESGRVTSKYLELRELLKKYLPAGETLPNLPDSIPTIAIPAFELTESSPIFYDLTNGVSTEDIQPFEDYDFAWGTGLYRTFLEPCAESQVLTITDVHDWAQVWVDGKRIGVIDRRKGERIVVIPPLKRRTDLDILVEAMGRINFGVAIKDYKGITQKVELTSGSNTIQLKAWKFYGFPSDYSYVKGRKYIKGRIYTPGYIRGYFHLNKTGDTFLDMSTWGKGLVWVNGHAIGRFWKIGPQQTLYVPGCWLKKGKNEVVVFDIETPSIMSLEGLRQPILDKLRVSGATTHRRGDQNLDLTNEKPLIEGAFTPGNGWQKVLFSESTVARFLCIEALSSHGNDPFTSIAELEVIGADGNKLSRENWKILYADSEETADANNTADKVFDLQESTFWHTAYSLNRPDLPHQIVIDLGDELPILGFMYLSRAESDKPGMIKDYRVFVKKTPFSL